MGRKVLFTIVYWVMISQTFGEKQIYGFAINDIKSSQSVPRLYRNVPIGVYASATPYGAYSFHKPIFISSPKTAASQVVPVKENFVNHLTDSYGNQFVGTTPLSSYRLSLPQQYIQLQGKLPEHLAQPLVAASANFQFKESNGHILGTPYRVKVALPRPAPTPLHHLPTFGQLYGNNVKYLTPVHSQAFGNANIYQLPTNNKAVSTNANSFAQYNNDKQEPKVYQQKELPVVVGEQKVQSTQEIPLQPNSDTKYQRIQEALYSSHSKPKKAVSSYKGEDKYQKIKETPKSAHYGHKLQGPQNNPDEVQFQRIQELPYYESKFQIIEDQPQIQRIQEHRPTHGEVKFQRIQEAPSVAYAQHTYEHAHETPQNVQGQNSQNHKEKQLTAPAKQIITYVNDINGQKTVVELETKPNIPLLDLSLLEPLTFDNPIVPQVQHFLPRISQATYQKLPEFNKPVVKEKEFVKQSPTSHDGVEGRDNPNDDQHIKKHKKPTQLNNKSNKNNEAHKKMTVTLYETLDDAPEVTYEVNAPNYKETVKEKSVSYNMKTQSDPVHYAYGSKSEKEPVTYSYSRKSSEPAQIKSVKYQGNDPSHLIYNFKPQDPQVHNRKSHNSAHSNDAGREAREDSSYELDDDTPSYQQHGGHKEQYKKHNAVSSEDHDEPVHNEMKTYIKQHEEGNSKTYHSEPLQYTSEEINFQPILKQYEDNIRVLTPSASIKVNPNQHIQAKSQSHPNVNLPHQHPHSSPAPYSGPAMHHHVREKSKQIIIQEEAPDEMHMLREQMRQEIVDQEENSEEDFEKAYHDAAIGFPAYNDKARDSEKDIFDPDSYGVPRDHVEYDFDHTPLQQYQADGDNFPKEARSSYKDARDNLKQNYYTDFAVSKPEGLLDSYQNKLGYYKLFKEQKPDYLSDYEQDKKEKKKSSKYIAAPSFDYYSSQKDKKSDYGHSKPKQQLYEYYSKAEPRDNSAFASRPYQNYKTRTSFVEPQFQYGFEPIALPKLLDSELAAMASNDSPESEKPGMRKKVYKENWYIKKTSTSAGAPKS